MVPIHYENLTVEPRLLPGYDRVELVIYDDIGTADGFKATINDPNGHATTIEFPLTGGLIYADSDNGKVSISAFYSRCAIKGK